jgi:hypothetical protein
MSNPALQNKYSARRDFASCTVVIAFCLFEISKHTEPLKLSPRYDATAINNFNFVTGVTRVDYRPTCTTYFNDEDCHRIRHSTGLKQNLSNGRRKQEWIKYRSCAVYFTTSLPQAADSVASNDRLTGKIWIIKDLEGSDSGLTAVLSRRLPGGTEKTTTNVCQNSLYSGRDSNQAPPERYRYINLLGHHTVHISLIQKQILDLCVSKVRLYNVRKIDHNWIGSLFTKVL